MSNDLKFTKFLDFNNFPKEAQKFIKDYICPLCKGVIYEPQTDICGHLFCKQCIKLHINTSKYCPIYKDKLIMIQDIIVVKNIINGKKINCKNFRNCGWSDKVELYKNHLDDDCIYEKIICGNSQKLINRKELNYDLKQGRNREEISKNNKPIPLVKCIYRECDKFINNDLTSHLIESRLSHEKLFINEFYKLKRSIEDRLCEIDNKANLRKKKKRDELIEFTGKNNQIKHEEDKVSSQVNSIDKKSKLQENHILKKNNNKYDDYIIQTIPHEINEFPVSVKENNSIVSQSSHKLEGKKKSNRKKYIQVADAKRLMNVIDYSRGLKIIGNTVINKATTVKHRFGFMNYVLNETSLKWSVEIKRIKEWIGLGICFKDEIIVSGFKFDKPLLHSSFLISSNGYVWNCFNEEENGIEYSFLILEKGDIIKFHFDNNYKILTIKFKEHKIKLTKIHSQKMNFLVPCVILLNENDEVEFNLIN